MTQLGIYVIKFAKGVKVGLSRNFVKTKLEYLNPYINVIHDAYFLYHPNPEALYYRIKGQFKEFTKSGSSDFYYQIDTLTILSFINSNKYHTMSGRVYNDCTKRLITIRKLTKNLNLIKGK